MNILYISTLPISKSGGPRYSIPKQIESQSKYDNVYWVNLNNVTASSKVKQHNILERFNIGALETPFNNPDLVVFEDFYYYKYISISKYLKVKKIPYIIVPRGSMTRNAQKIKSIKKIMGNLLFFKRFAKDAAAIHFLTKQELRDSKLWNKNNIIIPNGIEKKQNVKTNFSSNGYKGIFIGRFNMYHKGLDMLIEACINIRDLIIKNNCILNLYGPNRNNAKEYLMNKIINNRLEKNIFIFDEIYGEEKEIVLQQADFSVLTSRFEGLPMGVLDCLSYGIPCLLSNGSNMLEEVISFDAGWSAGNSVSDIEKGLKEVFNSRNQLQQKSKNALKLAEKYNWDEIAKLSHKEYLKIKDGFK